MTERPTYHCCFHSQPPPAGALYGTYEAFKLRIPGVYKIRHIGQATLGTGLAFGVFMAAGAFVQSGRSH